MTDVTPEQASATDLLAVQLLAAGLTQRQVAKRLGTTDRAVATRMWRLRRRIGAHSTVHAVAILARTGQLDLTGGTR